MKIIGLTGNSGCGKGAVSEIMAEYGAVILDCDKIAHKNMLPSGIAYNDIISAFGFEILNGDKTINRKALGNIVFNSKDKLALLNSITHKYIIDVVNRNIELNNNKKCVVLDAPLLIEAGLNSICDSILAVYAPFEVRVERVIKRDNISREEALNRFENQMDFEEIKKYADEIIENKGNLEDLRKSVVEYMNNKELI